jgi:hypothetical protein
MLEINNHVQTGKKFRKEKVLKKKLDLVLIPKIDEYV